MGLFTAYLGEWDRGCELVERARKLNARHLGVYWYPLAHNAYRRRDYQGALDYALRINQPGQHILLAAAHGQLGNHAQAAEALGELRALNPDFEPDPLRDMRRWFAESEHVDHLLEGLRKAGMKIDGAVQAGAETIPGSGAQRADEGFWVAVLPFRAAAATSEIAPLADGLFEEVVAGLSRFSYLRVIARSSTLRFAAQPADVRSVGTELGARYVIDGSLRQAGGRIRLTVQLVDASTGAQMWAETCERPFEAGGTFEVMDDLAPRIVSTVADLDGVLPQSMPEALRVENEDEFDAARGAASVSPLLQELCAGRTGAGQARADAAVDANKRPATSEVAAHFRPTPRHRAGGSLRGK